MGKTKCFSDSPAPLLVTLPETCKSLPKKKEQYFVFVNNLWGGTSDRTGVGFVIVSVNYLRLEEMSSPVLDPEPELGRNTLSVAAA